MTLPAEGWFPDPQDVARLRWWDGRTWGVATQPAPRTVTFSTAASQSAPAAPQFSVCTTSLTATAWASGGRASTSAVARRFCLFGWGSLAVALLSGVVNPDGVLSVVAVLLAVLGIARPRGTGGWRTIGQSMAVSAIVLAAATGMVSVLETARLF